MRKITVRIQEPKLVAYHRNFHESYKNLFWLTNNTMFL